MKKNKYTTEDLKKAVSKKDAIVISKYDMENFKTILSSLTPDEIRGGDEEDWTPLMCAASEGNVEMVKLLLPYYSLENIAKESGESTALILAAKHRGNAEVVRLLLDAGLTSKHIMMEDEEGSTALSWALENGYDEIVEMLLPLLTPEQIWKKVVEGDESYVSYILSSTACKKILDVLTPILLDECASFILQVAVSDHSLKEIKNVLTYLPKESISELAEKALSSVGGEFDSESNEKMKLLLSYTSDNKKSKKRKFPNDALINAVSWNTKKIEMLLKNFSPEELRIQNNTTNSHGQTALMLAAKWDFRQCIAIMLPYLSSEQLQMTDLKGKTAKDLAKFPQAKEMIQKRIDELQ